MKPGAKSSLVDLTLAATAAMVKMAGREVKADAELTESQRAEAQSYADVAALVRFAELLAAGDREQALHLLRVAARFAPSVLG